MKEFRLEDCSYNDLIEGVKCCILTDVYNLFIMDAVNYKNEIILLNEEIKTFNNFEIKTFHIKDEGIDNTFYYVCKIDFKKDNRFLKLDFNRLNYFEITRKIQNYKNINEIQVKKNINNFKEILKSLNIKKEVIIIDIKRIL